MLRRITRARPSRAAALSGKSEPRLEPIEHQLKALLNETGELGAFEDPAMLMGDARRIDDPFFARPASKRSVFLNIIESRCDLLIARG